MANELRVRSGFLGGLVEDNPLTAVATTLTSASLASVPVIGSTQHMAIVFDPDGMNGAPEIVYITAHSAAATTATILRGQESSVARAHDRDVAWVHSATTYDLTPWVQTMSIAGTEAMTDWSSEIGTWVVNAGGYWENTNTSRSVLYYNPTQRPHNAGVIVQADLRNPSGGLGNTRMGVCLHSLANMVFQPVGFISSPGTGQAGPAVLDTTTSVQPFGITTTMAFDVWYTVRIVCVGPMFTVYLDGVSKGTAYAGADYRAAHSFGLWSQDGRGHFRNIKVWTETRELPA